MLSIRNLEVAYQGAIHVLHGVSVDVPDGSIVALLGVNGSGKTTIARAISGLLPLHDGAVRAGVIEFQGRSLVGMPARRRTSLGLGQVMEGRRIFTSMTVEGNLLAGTFGRARRGQVADRLEEAYFRFPKLRERAHQRSGFLSGGEQQMLAIARALMGRPRLLILDEPSLGLAPAAVEEVASVVRDLHAEGTSILLIEQAAQMALSLADHGYVLETGRVVHDGTADELLADRDIREFYLGVAEGSVKSIADTKRYKRRKRWLS
jgi:branched-chain amino acid transport system ATP-binding protein